MEALQKLGITIGHTRQVCLRTKAASQREATGKLFSWNVGDSRDFGKDEVQGIYCSPSGLLLKCSGGSCHLHNYVHWQFAGEETESKENEPLHRKHSNLIQPPGQLMPPYVLLLVNQNPNVFSCLSQLHAISKRMKKIGLGQGCHHCELGGSGKMEGVLWAEAGAEEQALWGHTWGCPNSYSTWGTSIPERQNDKQVGQCQNWTQLADSRTHDQRHSSTQPLCRLHSATTYKCWERTAPSRAFSCSVRFFHLLFPPVVNSSWALPQGGSIKLFEIALMSCYLQT